MDPLTPNFDLSERVIYFPVRHHSPACAWHIAKLIRDLRPDHVLIEGPRDANHILPLLDHDQTRQPVAIYATFVEHSTKRNANVARHAAYYPLCDFSPELNAIQCGREVGADVRFIDLSFAEKVKLRTPTPKLDADVSVSHQPQSLARATNLQSEPWYSHSELLKAACKRSGSRDADDLWDHLFEVRFRETSTPEFMRGVWAYCSLARRDHYDANLAEDGCLARERAMAFAVNQCHGKTVVVTGGFHAVVLAQTPPALPQTRLTAKDDAQVVLMRYSFDQLDRLNGYASGMPSPGFYQSMWEGESSASLLIRIARECRQRNLPASTADVEAAVNHVHLLAEMRGHVQASREDFLDAVRSLFVKGEMDREGVAVMAIARKLLAGDTVGEVPEEAGQPPIVNDFRSRAAWLKLKLDKIDTTRTSLDLYRNARHRHTSRLFHQLAFLQIPFATLVQGPDFVMGTDLHRVREVWAYHWSPQTESSLIVSSVYGATLDEAASARLMEQFAAAEAEGIGGSASAATQLVVLACRMGLHRQTKSLFLRLETLLGRDGRFHSVVQALEGLLLLNLSKEPLETRNLPESMSLAVTAFHRACYLMHRLSTTPETEEAQTLDALNTLALQCSTLPGADLLRPTLHHSLQQLLASTGQGALFRGAAAGLLYGESVLSPDQLVKHCRGHWSAAGVAGASFLRGLLGTARSTLWQLPQLVACLSDGIKNWSDEEFMTQLPHLRLALTQLAPQETDLVARQVTDLLADAKREATHAMMQGSVATRDAESTHGEAIDRWLRDRLRNDGFLAKLEEQNWLNAGDDSVHVADQHAPIPNHWKSGDE